MSKLHEKMISEGKCPRCGEQCSRDEVDIGVGIQCGPWGCSACGWSEDTTYDLEFDGGFQEDGGYRDPQGRYWPAGNPVVKLMRQAEKKS